jgi:hypothetical protein
LQNARWSEAAPSRSHGTCGSPRNKESLTPADRQELLALVEFADEKTAEKLQAQAALRRIDQVFPKLASPAS